MAQEGVVEATWTEAKAHPYIIGGAVVLLVALMWYFSKPSPAATPQNFSFSYGPSDAQVSAGTALQIAQQADTTNLAIANINAGVQTTTAGDYYTYLTTANQSNNLASINNTQVQSAASMENAYLNEQGIALQTASSNTQAYLGEQQAVNLAQIRTAAGQQA